MTELAVYEPAANLPTRVGVPGSDEFDSWIAVASDVVKLANVIYDTPFVPDGLRNSAPAVAAAILAGRELGLPPLTSLANIHVIKGKPSLSAVLMRALILAQGHQWRDVEVTDTRAVIEARRKSESEWTRVTFTADQAKQASIQLGGYPQDKLYARATSRMARRKFADVIAGMPYSAEELEDGDADEGTVTEPPAASNGSESAPKPRTAQRKPRQAAEPGKPAEPESPPRTATPAPAHNQPPLPGEDDPEPPPPALADARLGKVRGIIHQHFTRLGFTPDDREQRLSVTATLAGMRHHELASTNDLTLEQASVVADTLAKCKDRDKLIALLAAEVPDA